MNEKLLTLESLPNEILVNIFGYLHITNIFQSVYNLNIRFNKLIESLNHLHLIVQNGSNVPDANLYSHLVRSLITIGNVDIDFRHFQNIHRLVLRDPTNTLLDQLNGVVFLNLECLSIPDVLFGMSPVYQQVFSNVFPDLIYCYLLGFETIETILPWTETPSLRVLKVGFIDFYVYKAILSSCPNLKHFELKIFQSYLKLSHVRTHLNLKRLKMASDISDWHYNDQLIDMLVVCAPYIEHLTIHRSMSISEVADLIPDFDWFASIIATRLPLLQYFTLNLKLEYHLDCIEFISSETRRQLRKFFSDAHKNRYQSRLIIQ